jgi:ribonuclease D
MLAVSRGNKNSTRMGNDEARMTKRPGSSNAQMTKKSSQSTIRSSRAVDHSSFTEGLISSAERLNGLITFLNGRDRVAVDTEADSLHCYREKLCLLQLSIPEIDFIVDPLALRDLQPLAAVLKDKEIVLHGADFDLRLLRRSMGLVPERIFDTVLAARLLGQRQFSLAALVHRYFNVELPKGSQKANWARRPLPKRMLAYAVNDTHYLLDLAERMEAELATIGRSEWFRQSCQRAIEQATMDRTREPDDVWRISGSGALRGQPAAILRELWKWREMEAEAVDRPVFHILQNEELIRAAKGFHAGEIPDYRHFSPRRRDAFMAAAKRGMEMAESEWPIPRRRFGTRRTAEANRRVEELRQRRDDIATELDLEPSFVAPRAALESIASDESRSSVLLVAWQRELLGLASALSSF